MTFRYLDLGSLLAAVTLPAGAEVYRHVDKQGNVTFSDEPTEGAEAIQVKPVTTVTLPKLQDVSRPERRDQAPDGKVRYDQASFAAPQDGEAFHSGSGDIEFRVSSSPALGQGHKYEITLDGQPVAQSASGSLVVRNVYRGTHQAAVHVIDENGLRVFTGDSISFTVHRPSARN